MVVPDVTVCECLAVGCFDVNEKNLSISLCECESTTVSDLVLDV